MIGLFLLFVLGICKQAVAAGGGTTFDSDRNILIADHNNHRVVEMRLNPFTGEFDDIIYPSNAIYIGQYNNYCNLDDPITLTGPSSAQRIGCGYTVVSTADDDFCSDHRVLIFDACGIIAWQYNTGLFMPQHAVMMENDYVHTYQSLAARTTNCTHNTAPHQWWFKNIMVADTGNNRVIVIDPCDGTIVWEYRKDLSAPTMTQQLANGNILIADAGNDRYIEIDYYTQEVVDVHDLGGGREHMTRVSRVESNFLPNPNTDWPLVGTQTLDVNRLSDYIMLQGKAGVNHTSVHAIDNARFGLRLNETFYITIDKQGYNVRIQDIRNPRNVHNISYAYGLDLDGAAAAYEIGNYMGQTLPPTFKTYPKDKCLSKTFSTCVGFGK